MRFASTCRELTVLLLTVCAAAAGASPQRPGAVFRDMAELVVLQVVVADEQGQYVPELDLDDFAVYENGVRQTPTLFASSTAPLDLVVILDTSVSMEPRFAAAQQACLNLLRALREDDQASLVTFSDSVRVAQEMTADRGRLEAAVRNASVGGSTALYEALYVSIRDLARARRDAATVRRQAIVVLSDGDDNRSRGVGFEDVLDAARRSAVTIFTIVPAAPESPAQRGRQVAMLYEMRMLAADTGGRAFVPAAPGDLAAVYDDIAGELAQQYWLAYPPPPSASHAFRRVSVRVEGRPGLRARTRSGYYGR
jgi:VWFA-related protein